MTGLHDIETLIGDAAVPVALDRAGEPRHVPAVVGLGAYRVVREALAGARSATGATVAIEYMPGALAVQVDHDGGATDVEELAQLAAELGGGLTAGRAPGGFRVRAWLPTEGQPPHRAEPLAVH